ncbi:MAG: zinc ABC transporter substrate-binding protein [Candidatus Eisenbacteria sp.]|nr:zinc ABC transporter substrate-binding protein [Candidatus Eisenbacteria bacterium]
MDLLRRIDFANMALLLMLLACACASPGKGLKQERLPVVATIFPVADLVRNVGGAHVSVSTLLPAGASPHTFDPKPTQVRLVAEARIFFEIGAGLEQWSGKIARASGNRNLDVVQLSDGLELLCSPDGRRCETELSHTGSVPNPHVWLDPQNAIRMVERIACSLSKVDPEHAAAYEANAAAYGQDLQILDEEIRSAVERFSTRRYVAFHSAWIYFAHRYGLQAMGIIEESPGKEATPKHLKGIIDVVRSHGVAVIFAEPQLNSKEAEVIARESGAQIAFLDPLGGEDVEGRDSYLNLMRYNLSEMERTLGE